MRIVSIVIVLVISLCCSCGKTGGYAVIEGRDLGGEHKYSINKENGSYNNTGQITRLWISYHKKGVLFFTDSSSTFNVYIKINGPVESANNNAIAYYINTRMHAFHGKMNVNNINVKQVGDKLIVNGIFNYSDDKAKEDGEVKIINSTLTKVDTMHEMHKLNGEWDIDILSKNFKNEWGL